MLNAKGRRCDVCARSPLLFFIFILSDVLARFKVIVMNYFSYCKWNYIKTYFERKGEQ